MQNGSLAFAVWATSVCSFAGGCVRSGVVTCPDSSTCPAATICVVASPEVTLCLPLDARAACVGLLAGATCDGDRGRCYDGACVPIRCGDRLVDPGLEGVLPAEACDDGNNSSGDHCSADCLSDETCGNGHVDPIANELCDDGNPRSHDGCDSTCSPEQPHWTRRESGDPGGRLEHAAGYDPQSGGVVMFGGSLADDATWIWRGRDWERSSAPHPSLRFGAATAADTTRRRIVLFGGSYTSSGGGDLADLWEWDGRRWRFLAPSGPAPSRTGYAAAAFDSRRERFVMFGGVSSSIVVEQLIATTWEWDGVRWLDRSTAQGPSARRGAAMTYDPVRGVVVMFGGATAVKNLDELWEWDGNSWTLRVPAGAKPAPRSGAAMAAYHGEVLMFGGIDDVGLGMDDLWRWDGASWTQLPDPMLGKRMFASLTYDLARDRLVLVGGSSLAGPIKVAELDQTGWHQQAPAAPVISTPNVAFDTRRRRAIVVAQNRTWSLLHDAWEDLGISAPSGTPVSAMAYDEARDEIVWLLDNAGIQETWTLGTSLVWTRRAPAPPPRRAGAALGFDRKRERVVLFGGSELSGAIQELGDTWEWDGTSWTQHAVNGPPARVFASFAYDPSRKRLVLFGGTDGDTDYADVWTWDGATWVAVTPASGTAPNGRSRMAWAWNPLRNRMLMFGGFSGLSGATDDAWEWNGVGWREIDAEFRPPNTDLPFAVPSTDGQAMYVMAPSLAAPWRLTWQNGNNFEQCSGGLDIDGDGLVGCADPDCIAICSPTCEPSQPCPASSPRCGDHAPGVFENCRNCNEDLGACALCGDAICDGTETSSTCQGDCP